MNAFDSWICQGSSTRLLISELEEWCVWGAWMGSEAKHSIHDDVFHALAHRVRRNVIRVLAERGPRSFTDLMRDVGVEDSSVMAFHVKKLGNLVRKNEKGFYELTELGWKAYRLLKELELESLSDSVRRVVEERSERVKEVRQENGMVIVENAVLYELTGEDVDRLLSEGRGLVVRNVVRLRIASDVDPEKLRSVLKEVSNVLFVDAPPELKKVVLEKGKNVDVVRNTFVRTIIDSVVRSLVPTLMKSLLSLSDLKRIVGTTRIHIAKEVPTARSLRIDVVGSDISLSIGQGNMVRIEGEGSTASRIDVRDVGSDTREIKIVGIDGALTMPISGIENLSLTLKGGDLTGSLSAESRCSIAVIGGDLELDLVIKRMENLECVVKGGDARMKIDVEDVVNNADIYVDVSGGDAELEMLIPRNVDVHVKELNVSGGDYDLVIEKSVRNGTEKTINLHLRILGGDAKLTIRRKT